MKFRGYDIQVVKTLDRTKLDGAAHHDVKIIEIGAHCRGKRELETIVHELLHATDPSNSECKVKRDAKDIAQVLWKWGYRKAK